MTWFKRINKKTQKTNGKFINRLSNQKGQSVLEYVILTSLIGIFCLVGVKTFGERIKTRIDHMNSQIAKHMRVR